MQTEIRQASPSDFSDLQRFKDYKKNDQLSDAHEVAESLMRIANHPEDYQDTLLDVRKL
jgi:benzil reductase ((S)-benzoin forming)